MNLFQTADLAAVYNGMRVVFHGMQVATPYNQQLVPGGAGTVQAVENGQVFVAFDKGFVAPLTPETDRFTGL